MFRVAKPDKAKRMAERLAQPKLVVGSIIPVNLPVGGGEAKVVIPGDGVLSEITIRSSKDTEVTISLDRLDHSRQSFAAPVEEGVTMTDETFPVRRGDVFIVAGNEELHVSALWVKAKW